MTATCNGDGNGLINSDGTGEGAPSSMGKISMPGSSWRTQDLSPAPILALPG